MQHADRQEKLLKKIDHFSLQIDAFYLSSANDAPATDEEDSWLRIFRSAGQSLQQCYSVDVKSHTDVYEATAYLMLQGLMDVNGESSEY